jgi:hypothetical protein
MAGVNRQFAGASRQRSVMIGQNHKKGDAVRRRPFSFFLFPSSFTCAA